MRRGRPPSGGRERILAATFDLLREKGIARLTTKEIAARAEVSEGSIFYHYNNREGLLSAVFEQALTPLVELRDRGVGEQDLRSTLNDFAAAVEQFLERAIVVMFASQSDFELRGNLTAYLQENVDRRPLRGIQLISDYLASLQESGTIRSEVDVETATYMLVASCFQRVSLPWLIGSTEGVPARDEVVDTFIALLAP